MHRTTTDIKHYIITIVLVLMNHNSPSTKSAHFLRSTQDLNKYTRIIIFQTPHTVSLIHALKRTVIINDGPL